MERIAKYADLTSQNSTCEQWSQLKVAKYFSLILTFRIFHCALPWPEGSGGIELQGTNLLNRHRLSD